MAMAWAVPQSFVQSLQKEAFACASTLELEYEQVADNCVTVGLVGLFHVGGCAASNRFQNFSPFAWLLMRRHQSPDLELKCEVLL